MPPRALDQPTHQPPTILPSLPGSPNGSWPPFGLSEATSSQYEPVPSQTAELGRIGQNWALSTFDFFPNIRAVSTFQLGGPGPPNWKHRLGIRGRRSTVKPSHSTWPFSVLPSLLSPPAAGGLPTSLPSSLLLHDFCSKPVSQTGWACL